MSKFKTVVKNFSLGFLGDDWKEAYINYEAVTIDHIKNEFPEIASLDPNDVAKVKESFNTIMNLIKKRFIDGKAPDKDGKLIDLTKDDLEELPAEVIGKSLSFLSQGVAPNS